MRRIHIEPMKKFIAFGLD